jgi:hypothetical protein
MDPKVYTENQPDYQPCQGSWCPIFASPPTIAAPVYMNYTNYFYFDWVMKVPTPVMMNGCFPERLVDDIDDEFDYGWIDDGEMAGEHASLFTSQLSTNEDAAEVQ